MLEPTVEMAVGLEDEVVAVAVAVLEIAAAAAVVVVEVLVVEMGYVVSVKVADFAVIDGLLGWESEAGASDYFGATSPTFLFSFLIPKTFKIFSE